MFSRLLAGALLLLASPSLAASPVLPAAQPLPSPTQLYRVRNSDFPERGHFVPTLAASNGAGNFETCSGEHKTETLADVDTDDGTCGFDPLSPSLPQAYLGKPVFINGSKIGTVNAFALSKDGQWEGGLIIDPTTPTANGTGYIAGMNDWALMTLGPSGDNYSVTLDKPLSDLQLQSPGLSPS